VSGDRAVAWAFVGASSFARSTMVDAVREAGGEVLRVVSSSPERARVFAEDAGIPGWGDDLDEALADSGVDAVYVSTTNDRHAAVTLAAAGAGKHVLCEKPLAMTLEDARSMKAACDAAGVVLATNHHLRNATTHRTIRRLIADGAVGEILAVRSFHAIALPEHLRTWRVSSPAGGGVVLDITVHDTDVLRFLLGRDVVEVVAMTPAPSAGVEHAVMGVLRFEGDVLASFHDAFDIAHAGTGLEIHGTLGSIIGREVMASSRAAEVLVRRGTESIAVDTGPPESMYVRALRAFHDAVRGEGAPAVTADDGIKSLAVALAVLESARTGRAVRVAA
jgi:1,5-anhydro-D-fructose reductase (1,5-anhydro-D-mannitol-forming)